MKILWLRPDKPDNISVGRHRISKQLSESGHDVEIWNTSAGSFSRVLTTHPDVVVGTTRLGAIVGAWKKIVHGTPLIVDHVDPISQLRQNSSVPMTLTVAQLEQFAFRVADHVFVVYEEELPRIERYANNITKTDLGVDYKYFADPPADILKHASTMMAGEVQSNRKILIYIGGLEQPYHVPTVFDAMEHLDGWQFVVLGDGTQRNLVESAAAERNDVTYFGTVDYELVPGFLHAADVGICLYDDRNTLKILEYGAAGLPAVKIEGDAEEKYDGLVRFCSLDPVDVARAVETADTDAPVKEFQAYTQSYDWERIADAYERVIRFLVD